jgi:hypothetical protein
MSRAGVKRFVELAAWTALITWIISGVIFFLVSRGRAVGHVPNWLEEDSAVAFSLAVVRGAAMLVSWIGSIYIWAKIPRSGFWHGVALVALIFLGMVIGPFYILSGTRLIHHRLAAGPETSGESP